MCAPSYIRAQTLKRRGFRWKGRTIDLQWQSPPIPPGQDERVQHTCFIVVDETSAKEAGFSFDMLVGADHGRALPEQMQALGAEETFSDGSSIIDQEEDPSALSFEMSRDAGPHALPDAYRRPPSEVHLSLSGPPDAVANLFKMLAPSGAGIPEATPSPAGRLNGLYNSASGKWKVELQRPRDDSKARRGRFVGQGEES